MKTGVIGVVGVSVNYTIDDSGRVHLFHSDLSGINGGCLSGSYEGCSPQVRSLVQSQIIQRILDIEEVENRKEKKRVKTLEQAAKRCRRAVG